MPQIIDLYNRKRGDYTSKLRAIKDNIAQKDRYMDRYLSNPNLSVMQARWNEEKRKPSSQSEVSADLREVSNLKPQYDTPITRYRKENIENDYYKWVENIDRIIGEREDLAEQRKDDLTRRRREPLTYNTREKNGIYPLPAGGSKTLSYPRVDLQDRYDKYIEAVKEAIGEREGLAKQRKDDLTRRRVNMDYNPREKNRIGPLPKGGGPTESFPREDITKRYDRYVEALKGANEIKYNDLYGKGKDDLLRRWQDNNHDPIQRNRIFGKLPHGNGPTPAYPREPRSIKEDIFKGVSNYDTIGGIENDATRHSNKYIETTFDPLTRKGNYVFSYNDYAQGDKGLEPQSFRQTGAAKGFNIGQVEGAPGWNSETNVFKNKNRNVRGLSDYRREISRHIIYHENYDLEVEAYETAAKWVGRARLPIQYYARVPLDLLIRQNQLRPTTGALQHLRNAEFDDGSNTTFAGFNTGVTDIQRSWSLLYQRDVGAGLLFETDNDEAGENLRAGTTEKFPRGFISRNDVRELEEPRHFSNGKPVPGTGAISFDDDAENNSFIRRERGFMSNIHGSVRNNGELLPAVRHIKDNIPQESAEHAEGQYFPFMFETANRSIDPLTGQKKTTVFEQFVYFQGTLSQMSETFSPEWSSTHFAGRSEDVHTYSKAGRAIDMRFIVFANSAREQQNVYERVNWLAQQVYPLYDNFPAKMSGGPIIKVTIGDIYKRVSGFIRSLSFNWDFLGVNKWQLQKGLRMPMACEITLQFQVIHDKQPNRDDNFYKGLSTGIMTGGAMGSNYIDDAGFSQDSQGRFVANKPEYWSPATNLIPMSIKPNPHNHFEETFVSLLARQDVVNTSGQYQTATFSDGSSRRLAPGETLTYADIIAAAGGAAQIGEVTDDFTF